jgi:hypothetical protein
LLTVLEVGVHKQIVSGKVPSMHPLMLERVSKIPWASFHKGTNPKSPPKGVMSKYHCVWIFSFKIQILGDINIQTIASSTFIPILSSCKNTLFEDSNLLACLFQIPPLLQSSLGYINVYFHFSLFSIQVVNTYNFRGATQRS